MRRHRGPHWAPRGPGATWMWSTDEEGRPHRPHGPGRFWASPGDEGPWGGRPFGPPFGPPSDDDSFGFGGGRRRQRRGDIKFALLELLAERPRHGYELIKELEQRYGGFYRPSPGTVYPTLQLLEEEGHLSATEADGKKIYAVTDSGRRLLEERQAEHGRRGPWKAPFSGADAAPAQQLTDLRAQLQGLLAAVQQVARHGTPAQQQSALDLLDETRRKLYSILAGEAPKE